MDQNYICLSSFSLAGETKKKGLYFQIAKLFLAKVSFYVWKKLASSICQHTLIYSRNNFNICYRVLLLIFKSVNFIMRHRVNAP